MIKRYLLLICLFLFCFTLTAQNNFTKAQLIMLSGDTLQGFIDYRNWKINPDEINFKKQLNAPLADSYTPLEISGFIVEGDVYVSAIVEKETSSVLTKNLTYYPELYLEGDTVFLQALVYGQKSLFFLRSGAKDHFYVDNEGDFELLIYKRYLKDVDDSVTPGTVKSIQENRSYLSQISDYLKDCPDMYQSVSTARYERSSLINVFGDYYNCVGADRLYTQEQEKIKPKFAVIAGVTLTSVNFKGSAFSSDFFRFLRSDIFSNSAKPTFGFSIEQKLQRKFQRLGLRGEFLYTEFLFNDDHFFAGDRLLTTNARLGFQYLKANLLLKYEFSKGDHISWFADAGISNGLAVGEQVNEYVQLREFPGPDPLPVLREGAVVEEVRDYEQGILLGVGGSYSSFSTELRVEFGNGMSGRAGLLSPTRRIMLLFSYTL